MNLKELRKSRGICQSFVAGSLDISARHFGRIENGAGYMTHERAKKLAKLYHVKVSEIMEFYRGDK